MRFACFALLAVACSTSSMPDDAALDVASDSDEVDGSMPDVNDPADVNDPPDVDDPDVADPPDAAVECPLNCIRQVVGWGQDGGKVFERAAYEVSECARVARSVERFDGADNTLCVVYVDQIQCGLVDPVSSLLNDDDVRRARSAAPILYGIDSRPADGTVFQIRFEEGTVSIGADCRGGAGCIEPPAAIVQLRSALEALQEAADTDPACVTPAENPDTFSCRAGLGRSTIECLTNEEYCFTPFQCRPLPDACVSCDCIPDAAGFPCTENAPGEIEVQWTE